ncbi:hypothetical protein SEA_RIZWANA_51 [Arthrobacter phage Rizwana]|nr:hypothetical protein SEA_RIZWANA_51 [Arthrobacter phage Rizwana]
MQDDVNASSYNGLNEQLLQSRGRIDRDGYYAEAAKNDIGWFVYRKRSHLHPGGLIGKYNTGERTIKVLNMLQAGLDNAEGKPASDELGSGAEQAARRMVDDLIRQAGATPMDGPYVLEESLDDVLIDGRVDMVALAKAALGGAK